MTSQWSARWVYLMSKEHGQKIGKVVCYNMGLYLKMAEPYKEPEELWEILCLTLEENGVEYDRENIKGIYEMASLCHKEEKR